MMGASESQAGTEFSVSVTAFLGIGHGIHPRGQTNLHHRYGYGCTDRSGGKATTTEA